MGGNACTSDLLISEFCLSVIDQSVVGIVFEFILLLISFGGLAVAAEHLCNSMETLCDHWGIHEDVGGATFVALGGSIPEITINCISIMKSVSAKSAEDAGIADMGVGAILGSGLIAFLVIPSLSCIFSSSPLVLRRKALYRDGSFYMLAVVVLLSGLYFGIGKFHGLVLILIYSLYVLSLVFGEHLHFFWGRELGDPHLGPFQPDQSTFREKAFEGDQCAIPLLPMIAQSESGDFIHVNNDPKKSENSFIETLLHPVRLAVDWTCPDCRIFRHRENWYALTFLISLSWITSFSYVITVVVERWVSLMNLPRASALFGTVMVAAGAEIPDLVNAVTIARRGFGGMAISACLGSQVINICLGLGLPWLITLLLGFKTQAVSPQNSSIVKEGCALLLLAIVVSVLTLAGGPIEISTGKTRVTVTRAWLLIVWYCVTIFITIFSIWYSP